MESVGLKVSKERDELVERISRLSSFLASDRTSAISPRQVGLLEAQLHIMIAYARILAQRLDDMKDNQD